MKGHRTSENYGFTLVELLTVIAIIAILAGLVLGVAGYANRKASVARAEADIEKIRNALEEYRAQYGGYPVNPVGQEANSAVLTSNLWYKPQQDGLAPFLVMKGWNDPDVYTNRIIDPWGRDYRYLQDPGSGRFTYKLWSEGPDASDAADDIGVK